MKRRDVLQAGTLVLLLGQTQIARGATIVAVRVWPAADYTRVTIESDVALKTSQLFVANPPRLAVDIEGIELNPALRELVGKVRSDDPYITGVRVGQFSASTVRLVLDLRQMVQPQVFNLPPVDVGTARYQHRLVLDLYPTKVADPLEALIAERTGAQPNSTSHSTAHSTASLAAQAPSMSAAPPASQGSKLLTPSDPLGDLIAGKRPLPPPASTASPTSTSPSAPFASSAPPWSEPAPPAMTSRAQNAPEEMERFVIVALDPGHGGEDPGAIGPRGTREKDVVLQIAHRLRDRINAATVRTRQGNLPMRAYLTRDADFFVPLHVRVDKARRVQADLFVSLHADAFLTPQARGASARRHSR